MVRPMKHQHQHEVKRTTGSSPDASLPELKSKSLFKVDQRVPLPPPRNRDERFPWEDMEPRWSFFVAPEDETDAPDPETLLKRMQGRAQHAAKRIGNGVRFIARKRREKDPDKRYKATDEEGYIEGVRVWRAQ